MQKPLGLNSGKISRLIKRLRVHRLIKKLPIHKNITSPKSEKKPSLQLSKLKKWCWFQHISNEYYAKKYINLKDKVLKSKNTPIISIQSPIFD